MKKTIGLLLIVGFSAHAADFCFDEPLRVVNSQRVSLQPLFSWWADVKPDIAWNNENPRKPKRELPPRPLARWVRITAIPEQTPPAGWEIEVSLQTSPDPRCARQERIFLRHPPQAQKRRVEQLIAQVRELDAATTQAYSSTVSETERAETYRLRAMDAETRRINQVNSERSRQHRLSGEALQARAQTSAAALAAARAELAKLPHDGSRFVLDTFAVFTGEVVRGLPVFDMGMVVR